MSDTNSIKKWPYENTQTPTPEKITWIPGLPETVLSITTDAWINNNLEKEKLSDKVKNILENTDNGLSIFFEYDEKNWILKAKRDNTNIKFLELLYSEIYDINIDLFSKIAESGPINQWDTIQVKSDWLYNNWKPIFWIIDFRIWLITN